MRDGVRYQLYESSDGHILFMASEREFWKNFCEGVGRPDLFESHPGSKYADHAVGDHELRDELEQIFRTRTSAEWLAFSEEFNTTIAPVNTPANLGDDPQFQDRLGFLPAAEHGADMLHTPIKYLGEELPAAVDGTDGGRADRRGAGRRARLGRRSHRRRSAPPAPSAEPSGRPCRSGRSTCHDAGHAGRATAP